MHNIKIRRSYPPAWNPKLQISRVTRISISSMTPIKAFFTKIPRKCTLPRNQTKTSPRQCKIWRLNKIKISLLLLSSSRFNPAFQSTKMWSLKSLFANQTTLKTPTIPLSVRKRSSIASCIRQSSRMTQMTIRLKISLKIKWALLNSSRKYQLFSSHSDPWARNCSQLTNFHVISSSWQTRLSTIQESKLIQ